MAFLMLTSSDLAHSTVVFYQDSIVANGSYDFGEEISTGFINNAGEFDIHFDITASDDTSTFSTIIGFANYDQALSVKLNGTIILGMWETSRTNFGGGDSDIEFVDTSASGSGSNFRTPWLAGLDGLDRLQATIDSSGVSYLASNNTGNPGYFEAFHDGSMSGTQTVVDPSTVLMVGQNTLTIVLHNNGGGVVSTDFSFTGDISTIPEPRITLLLGLGLTAFCLKRRRAVRR